jgi:hypothetical protein
MIGAIITLSIVAFVSLCLNVILFVINRDARRMVSWIEGWGESNKFIIERLTQAIEDIEWHFNHPPENPIPLKKRTP